MGRGNKTVLSNRAQGDIASDIASLFASVPMLQNQMPPLLSRFSIADFFHAKLSFLLSYELFGGTN